MAPALDLLVFPEIEQIARSTSQKDWHCSPAIPVPCAYLFCISCHEAKGTLTATGHQLIVGKTLDEAPSREDPYKDMHHLRVEPEAQQSGRMTLALQL